MFSIFFFFLITVFVSVNCKSAKYQTILIDQNHSVKLIITQNNFIDIRI